MPFKINPFTNKPDYYQTGGGGGGGATQLFQATVVLTPTDILNIATTPVVIIPAPAANQYIVPVNAVAYRVHTGTAYTAASMQLSIQYGDVSSGGGGPITFSNLLLSYPDGDWIENAVNNIGWSGDPMVNPFIGALMSIGWSTNSDVADGDEDITISVVYQLYTV